MNNKRTSIFIVVILLLIHCVFSCKKDNVSPSNNHTYETITPLSYFPVYPGSYWKYVDSNGDITWMETEPEYQLDYYTAWGETPSDTFYVPIYNGVPIWEYEEHTGSTSFGGSYPLATILSETLPVGQSWSVSHWAGVNIDRRIKAKDTTIMISGQAYFPTIVVDEFYSSGGPPNQPYSKRRYYTKDIGLIREDTYFYYDSSVVIKEMFDYFINH